MFLILLKVLWCICPLIYEKANLLLLFTVNDDIIKDLKALSG